MKYMLICVFLAGCSNVSFNKNINPEPKEFNMSGMHWERTIQDRQFLDRRPYMKK
jgi:hypothetical protein